MGQIISRVDPKTGRRVQIGELKGDFMERRKQRKELGIGEFTDKEKYEGEGIQEAQVERGVQQTTTQSRGITETNSQELDQTKASLFGSQDNSREDELTKALGGGSDATEGEVFDPADPYSGIKSEIASMNREAEREISRITSTLGGLVSNLDETTNAQIQQLRTVYAARINEMKDSNNRLLETKRSVGIRQGRARYAPTIEGGILSDEEIQGEYRIGKLEGELLGLIQSAETARREGKIELFNNQYEKVKEVQGSLKDEISNLYQRAIDRNEEIRASRKAEREATKANLDNLTKKAELSAPAVAEKIKGFSAEEKQIFLEAYAQKAGITDPDILYGEVEKYLSEAEKDELDKIRTRGLINSTAVTTASNQREEQEIEDKKVLRQSLFEDLTDGNVTVQQAIDVWVTAGFDIPDFNKEFADFIEI